jgi:hypothetical protein
VDGPDEGIALGGELVIDAGRRLEVSFTDDSLDTTITWRLEHAARNRLVRAGGGVLWLAPAPEP